MARLVYLDPTNYHNQYVTWSLSDPNIPAGFVLSGGSDGAADVQQQEFVAGVNSGGWPPYTEDPEQLALTPHHPNGLLGLGDTIP